jgi:phosphoribosyl 1,2-cyclic phosphodiesterase
VKKRGRPRKNKIPLKESYESELVIRIGECENVVNELDNSYIWSIIQKDLQVQRQMLDDNWQEIAEPNKLQKARELKFATLHILNLKEKYKEELEAKKKELGTYQNTDTVIPKDYDLEGTTYG